MLVRTSSPLLEGWEECRDLSELRAVAGDQVCKDEPDLHWKGGRIPDEMMKKVLGTIRMFPTREVGFVLYYNATTHEWDIECPEQVGYGGSVQFQGRKDPLPGFSEVGTIHTHPNMPAFWSGTDYRDQKGKFGVHCVLGLRDGVVDKYLWTIFTPNGDYNKPWNDLAEPVDFAGKYEPDQEWLKTLNKKPAAKLEKRARDGWRRWPDLGESSRGGELFHEERREFDFSREELLRELRESRMQEALDRSRRERPGRPGRPGRLAMVSRMEMQGRIEDLYSNMIDTLLRHADEDDVDVKEMLKDKLDLEDADNVALGSMYVDPDDDNTMSDLADACEDNGWVVCKPEALTAMELCETICSLAEVLVDKRDGTSAVVRMRLRQQLEELLPEVRNALANTELKIQEASDA